MEKADYERNRESLTHLILTAKLPQKPTKAQHNAIANACAVMQAQHADERLLVVLGYHVEKPDAFIFPDIYTMRALRAGINALNKKIERMERDEKYYAG